MSEASGQSGRICTNARLDRSRPLSVRGRRLLRLSGTSTIGDTMYRTELMFEDAHDEFATVLIFASLGLTHSFFSIQKIGLTEIDHLCDVFLKI
jgi:hypothetical protein